MVQNSSVFGIVEASHYLGVGLNTMYGLCKSKGFPAFKIGSKWKIVQSELDKWIQEKSDTSC